jgi:hypothetical protein
MKTARTHKLMAAWRAGPQRAESRASLIAAYLGRAISGDPFSRTAKYFGREESTFVRECSGTRKSWRLMSTSRGRSRERAKAVRRLIIQEVHG